MADGMAAGPAASLESGGASAVGRARAVIAGLDPGGASAVGRARAVIAGLEPFFDSLVEPVVCVDREWRVLYRNPASAASWRIRTGSSVSVRSRGDDQATLRLLDHDGAPVDVDVVLTAVSDSSGSPYVYVGRVTSDESDQVAELRQATAVITARVAHLEHCLAHPWHNGDEARLDGLSEREREVFDLILDGNRVATVAALLFLSENTVRNYLKRIYHKLGVHSLGELRERMGPAAVHRAS